MTNPARTDPIRSRSEPPAGWLTLLRWPSVIYSLFLVIFAVVYLLRFPIMAPDTDLWYHLTSGRYLFEHGHPPRESFFSFLSPPRPWTDYFWLFQALVYAVYRAAGYLGLIVLRSVLYGLTTLVVLRVLFNGRREQRTLLSWSAILFFLYCPFLLPRFFMARPHIITYLMIPLFLYVLECRPRGVAALPALAVLWCNFHGITYPVLLAIVGAYAAELAVDVILGRRALDADARRRLIALALCAAAVFATPHGLQLLRVPFIPTGQASSYIDELQRLTIFDATSIQISGLVITTGSLFNLLALAACFSAVTALRSRPIRISHLLLAAVGVVLVTRGHRFMNECALLWLPLLEANPWHPSGDLFAHLPKRIYLPLAGVVMLIPSAFIVSLCLSQPRYPFSARTAPEGICAFLRMVDTGGSVLNFPNNGGYFQWRLYPRYRIFMDMEVPLLFTDHDFYLASQMFADHAVLGKLVDAYHPAWISVPQAFKDFPEVVAHLPQYVMVFADDVEILYVDRQQQPHIAERFAITGVDLFALMAKDSEEILKDERKKTAGDVPLLGVLRPLIEVYPDGVIANHLAAMLRNDEKAYDLALPHAAAVIRNAPDVAIGYELRADALKGLRAFEPALAWYAHALDRPNAQRYRIERKLGMIYFEQQRYDRAYRALEGSVRAFDPKASLEELYMLWASARATGHAQRADEVLRYLTDRLPPDDREWRPKIDARLEELHATPSNTVGR